VQPYLADDETARKRKAGREDLSCIERGEQLICHLGRPGEFTAPSSNKIECHSLIRNPFSLSLSLSLSLIPPLTREFPWTAVDRRGSPRKPRKLDCALHARIALRAREPTAATRKYLLTFPSRTREPRANCQREVSRCSWMDSSYKDEGDAKQALGGFITFPVSPGGEANIYHSAVGSGREREREREIRRCARRISRSYRTLLSARRGEEPSRARRTMIIT